MSKVFSPLKPYEEQSKKDWVKKFLSENQSNKIENIQHKINNKLFDPIYFNDEVKIKNTFLKNKSWLISTDIIVDKITQANKNAIIAISEGANSICFNLKNKNISRIQINKLLKDLNLKKVNIEFANCTNSKAILKYLSQKKDSKNIRGCIKGLKLDKKEYLKVKNLLPNFKFFFIQVEKLILKEIEKKIPPYSTHKNLQFHFRLSNNFMFEISKIRSFRNWYSSIYNEPAFVSCETNVTKQKYHILIQTTIQAFAAIVRGCDSLNIILKKENTLGVKQQLILKHEGLLDKVTDPFFGSNYIEKLTNFLIPINNNIKVKEKIDSWLSPEGIQIKSKYSKKDLKNIQHLNFGAGIAPFLRGPYTSMYCKRKWTIRQYAGFSTAEKSNKFYKKNLKAGQTGLSVAFDLPTHRGYDSNHERVKSDVGMSGVAIDTVDDLKRLFKDIPIEKTSISMTMNGAVLPIMSFLIVCAQEKKIPIKKIKGTIQNDILKEFLVRNTYIYPPQQSIRIVSDIFKYTSKKMPKFNSISVSGYHMLEAGATAELELAYTLSNGLQYLKTGLNAGLKIDDFAPRISFFWGIGMNFFMEIAKMRAARILWSQIVGKFKPKNPKSLMLRTHCQTSGWSLTEQDPLNNITRTCLEALAAVMGGTQSLHTNAFDEAITLPTEHSAKIARDTQLFLQNESKICELIDPLGGSFYIENLTNELIKKAKKIIAEIEKNGGMTKLIELGTPKKKIEEAAIKRQAQIDSKSIKIIGLNSFQSKIKSSVETLDIDNYKVQKSQIEKIKKIKNNRDAKKVKIALDNITKACANKNKNLLDLCVKAAKERATLGEISYACEKEFKRYLPEKNITSGIYSMEIKEDKIFKKAKLVIEKFSKKNGRRPRILVAKIGQDGHDRGANIIATSFSDIGFDVDIGPLFQTPEEITKQAIENDVHIIGISSLAGGHKTLIPKLINCIKNNTKNKIHIVLGGIIPKKDYGSLKKKGVGNIFGPGTIIAEAAIEIIESISKK